MPVSSGANRAPRVGVILECTNRGCGRFCAAGRVGCGGLPRSGCASGWYGRAVWVGGFGAVSDVVGMYAVVWCDELILVDGEMSPHPDNNERKNPK